MHAGAPPVFQLQVYNLPAGVGFGVGGVGGGGFGVGAGGAGVGVAGADATALAKAQFWPWSQPTLHVKSACTSIPLLRRCSTIVTSCVGLTYPDLAAEVEAGKPSTSLLAPTLMA